jgi:hypothetical protein
MFTTSVPYGNARPVRDDIMPSTRNRSTDPAPPISTTPTHTSMLIG